jgi:hypothetical protein
VVSCRLLAEVTQKGRERKEKKIVVGMDFLNIN